MPCAQRYFCFLVETRESCVSPKIEDFFASGVGPRRCSTSRDSECVAGLFRAGVPPKVTHKGDRASVDYSSGHNKEVRTMRGTSFRHTAAPAVLNRVRTVHENARVFSERGSEMEIVSCGARSDVTQPQQCGVSKSTVAFVGHDMLFTRNYGNCERMHWTLAYPSGLSLC